MKSVHQDSELLFEFYNHKWTTRIFSYILFCKNIGTYVSVIGQYWLII